MNRLILILCGLYLTLFAFQNRGSFLQKYDANYWLDQYQHSQYYQGDKSGFILSDADTDAVRGYQLVIQHTDPIHVLPGHPFLGTYIIGLFIAICGNQNISAFIAGLICLIFVYKIILKISNNKLFASLGVVVTLIEPLFREQLTTSMLDVYLLMFSLISVNSFISWLKNNKLKNLVISQLFIGFALATKFFPATFPLLGAMFLAVLVTGNFKRFIDFMFSLCFIVLGFLLGHISYFYFHPSLIEFARFERYIISWWAGTTQVPPGAVWDLIFRNRWHTWWEDWSILGVETWWIGWSISILMTVFLSLYALIKKRFNVTLVLLLSWIAASLLFDSVQAVYPRHLLPVFTAAYIFVLTSLTSLSNTNRIE